VTNVDPAALDVSETITGMLAIECRNGCTLRESVAAFVKQMIYIDGSAQALNLGDRGGERSGNGIPYVLDDMPVDALSSVALSRPPRSAAGWLPDSINPLGRPVGFFNEVLNTRLGSSGGLRDITEGITACIQPGRPGTYSPAGVPAERRC
jgi:hypothetical protein